MNNTNKLTIPDLISIGVFTSLYFVLVTIATFSSALLFPLLPLEKWSVDCEN